MVWVGVGVVGVEGALEGREGRVRVREREDEDVRAEERG